MRGRSSGKTGPPVPGLTRVGGGAIMQAIANTALRFADPGASRSDKFQIGRMAAQGCRLSIDTTGTPEPSSLTSPEHFFSTKSTKIAV